MDPQLHWDRQVSCCPLGRHWWQQGLWLWKPPAFNVDIKWRPRPCRNVLSENLKRKTNKKTCHEMWQRMWIFCNNDYLGPIYINRMPLIWGLSLPNPTLIIMAYHIPWPASRGHVTLVAIDGTSILVPYHHRLLISANTLSLPISDLQMSCIDLNLFYWSPFKVGPN